MKMKPIKMDLQQRKIIHAVDAVRKEAWSRELDIILTSNGEPYFVPSNTAILICFKKEDQTEGCYDTLPDGTPAWKLSGNILTIVLSDQVLTFPGRVMLTVVFAHAGTELCTFPIEVNVHPSAWNKSIESENYFHIRGFLIAPQNAKIGQVLQVASVDNAGTVTGLQSVDPQASPGSSVTTEELQQAIKSYLNANPPAQGIPGKDGTSVTHRWNGTTLTVTSASGTSSANLKGDKGEKGDAGVQGPQGEKGSTGKDGVSPTVTVSKSGKVTTITINDANGTKTATISDGADGQDGENAFDPDAIPAYWQTALDDGVHAINTALCEAGRNKSAFLFYSDAHWNYGSQMAPALLKYLYRNTGMNKTFFGGDIVNDEGSDYNTMEYLWEWRKQLKDLPNHHSVPGNHDDGNTSNNLFPEQYVYSYLLAAEETPNMTFGDTGLYYYIDSPAEKTRYLCLDTGYQDAHMLSDAQADFIRESLISTPDEWHIVVVAHIWYGVDYDQYDKRPVPIQGLSATASSVISILDNYNCRSGEFADCGAWVEFCIGGHVHYDYDAVTETGIPIILVETDSYHTRGNYTATEGTSSEASVNGIIADYDNHQIHVIRIGRGVSREIKVSNRVASYTNVIPLSIDKDGTIFNGKGWADNSRIGSGGIYLGTGTACVTGYIELNPNIDNVFCLRNVGFDKTTNNNYLYQMVFFDASFARAKYNGTNDAINSNDFTNLVNVWDVTFDGNNLIGFKISESVISNKSVKYIAFCGDHIGDDSIITINEPIA